MRQHLLVTAVHAVEVADGDDRRAVVGAHLVKSVPDTHGSRIPCRRRRHRTGTGIGGAGDPLSSTLSVQAEARLRRAVRSVKAWPSGRLTRTAAYGSPRVSPRLTISTGLPAFAAYRTKRKPDMTVRDEPR